MRTDGDAGLINKKPCPYNPRLRTPPDIVEKVLHLRRTYHLGPIRIVCAENAGQAVDASRNEREGKDEPFIHVQAVKGHRPDEGQGPE